MFVDVLYLLASNLLLLSFERAIQKCICTWPVDAFYRAPLVGRNQPIFLPRTAFRLRGFFEGKKRFDC